MYKHPRTPQGLPIVVGDRIRWTNGISETVSTVVGMRPRVGITSEEVVPAGAMAVLVADKPGAKPSALIAVPVEWILEKVPARVPPKPSKKAT